MDESIVGERKIAYRLKFRGLAQIFGLVGNPATLLADIFGGIDERLDRRQVDIARATGQCAHFVLITTHRLCFRGHKVLLL